MATVDTKTQIIETAERLFAGQGFAATSLRNIIAEARVNLAAVHYHFGSKDELIRQVLQRRIEPLNAERLRLLDLAEADGVKAPDFLERVVEALVGPPLRLSRDPENGGEQFMRLIGRTFADADGNVRKVFFGMFAEIVRRFIPAFRAACPKLAPSTLFWRCQFLIGAMAHTMCDTDAVEMYAADVCDPSDVEGTIRELVSFTVAGFRVRTPPAPTRTSTRARR
ncbi:MAG TPA: TetR family transcriptional regulator [Verrucomicrobiales bacterium]|nr:TetR family transcriptional regulator [Verrucomicrobiales bacterium]